MKAISKRVSSLEDRRARSHLSLDHIPDDVLDELCSRLGKGFLNLDAGEVQEFQRWGLLQAVEPGPGRLRDWFSEESVREYENGEH